MIQNKFDSKAGTTERAIETLMGTKFACNTMCFNGRFWLRMTKIYIYSADLGLTVIAVENGSFREETITSSITGLKLEKFFKINLVLKLCCSAQPPLPSPAGESTFTGTQSISACSAVSFKNKFSMLNYLRKEICFGCL